MMGTRHWRGGWVQGINLAFSQIKHPDKLIIGNFVKHSLGSGGFRGHNSPSRVTLTRVFLVGADLKSTRHLYIITCHPRGLHCQMSPVHSLVQQRHVLDHQRREALRRRDPEPRSLPESKWRLCWPVLASLRGLAPGDIRCQLVTQCVGEGDMSSPQVVAVEGLAGEVPVPEHEVDLVRGVGRVDVTGQLRLPVLHGPHIPDWNWDNDVNNVNNY